MVIKEIKQKFISLYQGQAHIAPIAVLRIAFGVIMLISTVRFMLKGWVYAYYIKPQFHFTFYGFDWVKPFGPVGMYLLFIALAVACILVTVGLFYRWAITAFFLLFTYVELLDKTTYLNHYYLVSIMAFLLVLVPAGSFFSADVLRKPSSKITHVPVWCINIFKVQLLIVYFYAGLAKLNYDWLIAAVPLKIWLPANSHLPIIGGLLIYPWVAYAFSWFGAVFDLSIGFLLWNRKTVKPAYVVVIIFHLFTAWFFKIGMFPYIMLLVTVIFFPEDLQLKIISALKKLFRTGDANNGDEQRVYDLSRFSRRALYTLLIVHFAFQLLLPFRFLLYPGKLYWTEEGYRFSWRVMLMEKAGTIFFHVKDPQTGHQSEIINSQYLTTFQETQMSTQPDMILQFAHFLAHEYQQRGIKNPVVTAQSYVTLNGSGSRLYIDSSVNLAKEEETFGHKKWILPFNKNQE